MTKKLLAMAFFALVCAHVALAVDPPRVTVTQLFSELIAESEFEGWKVTGVNEILHWTQDHPERRKALADLAEVPVLVHPLTSKPVLLNGPNADFFIGVPADFARDGTWMGFKYAFLPESILLPAQADRGSPLFFFLLRHVPAGADPQMFEAPDQDQIDEKLSEISISYYCEHAAVVHHRVNQPGWCRVLLKKAVKYEDARTLMRYAYALQSGAGGPVDQVQARVYFKRAADQGLAGAQFGYASMLANGEGGPRDLAEARIYYKRAADQGLASAQFKYAGMLASGLGGPKDDAEARIYYKRAADQGVAYAQVAYGNMASRGEGGPQDDAETRTYYKRAADQGFAPAQSGYALMAFRGTGGPEDPVEARDYAKRSADQGDAKGEYIYATLLEKGLGGPADLANARAYYEKAATQGFEKAKQALERLKVEGKEPVEKKHKPEQK